MALSAWGKLQSAHTQTMTVLVSSQSTYLQAQEVCSSNPIFERYELVEGELLRADNELGNLEWPSRFHCVNGLVVLL